MPENFDLKAIQLFYLSAFTVIIQLGISFLKSVKLSYDLGMTHDLMRKCT